MPSPRHPTRPRYLAVTWLTGSATPQAWEKYLFI
jgi:hypothetical protein